VLSTVEPAHRKSLPPLETLKGIAMTITRRRLMSTASACAAAVVGLGVHTLGRAAPTTLRVAAFVPEKSFGVSRVIKPWMSAVEKDVGGQVKLQGFWGGTLGKDPFKQFELVRNGVADIAWVLPGYTPGQFPEMQVFELPALFENAVEAGVVGWRLYEKGMLKGFDGVRALTIFATEPMALWMREPIASLDDLRGKKIRSPGAVHARWLEAFGASAETMDSPEMNEMLNRKTLDGAIQGSTGMKTYKSLALVKQDYRVAMGVIPFLLLINEKRWAGLPDAVRSTMLKHGGEASAVTGGQAYEEAGAGILKELQTEGRVTITNPSASQLKAWAPRNEAVQQWWSDKSPGGANILNEVRR
jgi:TRAP-type C4-dicarboxylate transport system substrate-binding protein